MHGRSLLIVSGAFLSLWASLLQAAPSPAIQRFLQLEAEVGKEAFAGSQVPARYQPGPGVEFDVPYAWVPISELGLADSGSGSPALRGEILREIQGQTHFRFLIHPESLELYQPLLARFPIAGSFRGIPTASTRTLYVWDPTNDKAPGFFAKLSLNRTQLGLGRVVPDWEIRRSVAVTQLTQTEDARYWKDIGASVVPDFIGAWANPGLAKPAYIDAIQNAVFRHGVIYRDASFIENAGLELYPLFSLASRTAKSAGKAPAFVQKWLDTKGSTNETFAQFSERWLISPIVQKTAPLIFRHGILPDLHTQNIIVGLNPQTGGIKHVFVRDAGSMKVSFRIRLARGLTIEPLLTESTAYDFKPQWAEQLLERPWTQYFFNYVFDNHLGNDGVIKQYVPNYDSAVESQLLRREIQRASAREFKETEKDIERAAEAFLSRNLPPSLAGPYLAIPSLAKVETDILKSVELDQWLALPKAWDAALRKQLLGDGPWKTPIGIIAQKNQSLGLVLSKADAPQSPKHYLASAKSEQVVSLFPDKHEGDRHEYTFNHEKDTMPVYKTGTSENPIFKMIDSKANNRLTQLKKYGQPIRIEVLDDLTPYSAEQQNILIDQATKLVDFATCIQILGQKK